MSGVGLPVIGAVVARVRSSLGARTNRPTVSAFPRRNISFRATDPDAEAPPEDSGDEEFARVRGIKSERKHKRDGGGAHMQKKLTLDEQKGLADLEEDVERLGKKVAERNHERKEEDARNLEKAAELKKRSARYKGLISSVDEDASVIAVAATGLDMDEEAASLSALLHGDETSAQHKMLSSVNRNLALEMVRVTESAAVAAARWLGKGDKIAADGAAVSAMRAKLKEVDFDGIIVVGEGAKDNAPMLFPGEKVGSGDGPQADVAVDPLEGTSLIAGGKEGGIAVVAVAERNAMFNPGPIGFYVDKIAVGPDAAGCIDLTKSPTVNVHAIAKAKRKKVKDVTCAVLERDRHVGLIEELRLAGARIKLIAHGDVEAALATCDVASGVDALFGVGGAAEGVVAAAALRCAGGEMQAQLWPRDAADAAAMRAAGCDLTRVLRTEDLCGGEAILFAATGVSDGRALRGMRFDENGAQSSSLVMRYPSRTVRRIDTTHTWWTPEDEPNIASSQDEDDYERIYRAR
jgi:fructose-1,6-bisphosphatase II